MATTPPEVEATLARLHSHRNVKGLLILSSETGQVIRYSGAMLEEGAAGSAGSNDEALVNGARREASSDSAAAAAASAESATADADGTSGPASGVSIHPTVKRYADAVRRIVENSKLGVEEELDDQDRVKFLRIRTKKYEMMITPEDKYTLVVFHEPSSA